jgi:putative membrane protein
MKFILQSIVLHAIALLLTAYFLPGLKFIPSIENYLLAGILLTGGEYFLKPVFKIISLPLTMMTFGLFSFVINAAVLYIITRFYPIISVTPFNLSQIPLNGVALPSIHLNIFLSYALISATIYLIAKFLSWFFDR